MWSFVWSTLVLGLVVGVVGCFGSGCLVFVSVVWMRLVGGSWVLVGLIVCGVIFRWLSRGVFVVVVRLWFSV